MAINRGGVRRRGEIVTNSDTKNSDSESDNKPGDKATMASWCPRLFYPYRVLLLFSLVICVLQILVGISFFNTFSHRYSGKTQPSETQPAKEKLKSPPEPQIPSLSASATDLSFPCNITGKEALSAINRATTKGCKQEIVDLMCSLEKGLVYPTSLPRSCPNQVDKTRQGKNLGCFQDSFTKRLLQGHLVKLKTQNSPSICTEVCSNSGFSYSGKEPSLIMNM